jgi:hypothetical protein
MRYLAFFVLFVLLLIGLALPMNAQEGSFPTNTPSGGSLFATNTPMPVAPTDAPLGPEAPLFNYSLRSWDEAAFLDLAYRQIATLGDSDSQIALSLTLYEMNLRFPDAPSDMEERRELVAAMLAAPVGTIDMRSTVRPLIAEAINLSPDSLSLTADGFEINLSPANLDNRGGLDRVAHVLY